MSDVDARIAIPQFPLVSESEFKFRHAFGPFLKQKSDVLSEGGISHEAACLFRGGWILFVGSFD